MAGKKVFTDEFWDLLSNKDKEIVYNGALSLCNGTLNSSSDLDYATKLAMIATRSGWKYYLSLAANIALECKLINPKNKDEVEENPSET